MRRWWVYWYPSYFRWPELGLSLPTSSFRWPDLDFSWQRWSQPSLQWLEFSIDEVLWSLVTAVESIALVTMLCYFFLFCGCTL
ncbi:hypothetical protein LINGRAHAP2_LOCUS6167 [Linum grandiflorum]